MHTWGGTPLHGVGRAQTCDLGTVVVNPKSRAKTKRSPELPTRSSLARHHWETFRQVTEGEEEEGEEEEGEVGEEENGGEGEGGEGGGEGAQNAAYTSPTV